jgi:hypothetical protein
VKRIVAIFNFFAMVEGNMSLSFKLFAFQKKAEIGPN